MAMHDLNQVSGVVDRVALLVDGELTALGTPEQVLTPQNIKAAYQTEVIAFTHPQTGQHMVVPKE